VIVNNVPGGGAFGPGGTDRKVTIPSVMVSFEDGATLRSRIPAAAALHKSNLVALQLDGDLDADIVFHEYGHGLTWRMIGGMSGTFAGAIGEGASDVVAFLHNGDDRIGEYAYSNPLGIRREPYASYSLTYKNWTSGEVHNDGEIYAAAMWKVLVNYQALGLTADDVLADFVDGMNFTQSTPRPEHMRDGMIQGLGVGANASNNPRFCAIWRGFANRGIGVGATVTGKGRLTITESFAVPAGCAAP